MDPGLHCGAGQAHEGGVDIVGPGFGDDARDRAVSQYAPLMQDHEVIARRNLIEQMGRPKHADALPGDQLADVTQDVAAGAPKRPAARRNASA